jgi:hypothetical protein
VKKLTMLAAMLALALMIAAPASAQTIVVNDDETSLGGVITVSDDDFGAGFPFDDDDDIEFGGGFAFDHDDDDFGGADDDDDGDDD